jgi:molybdate transport system ATP-binding protein
LFEKAMPDPDLHDVSRRRQPARVPPGAIGVSLESASIKLAGRAVLRSIDLRLTPGSHSLIVGPNGAGKSELLKLLAAQRWPAPGAGHRRCYLRADGSTVNLRDILPRLQLVSAEQQDRYERYDWNFTVGTVVGTGCRGLDAPLAPLSRAERKTVAGCLKTCGIEAFRRRRFLRLSYGERRLVLVARALAARPAVLLLDEVHNGLDSANRRKMDALIHSLCRTPVTLVVAAHRAADAHPALDRAIAIEAGQIAYSGPRAGLPVRWRRLVTSAKGRLKVPSPAMRAVNDAEPLVQLAGVSVYRDEKRVLHRLSWRIKAGEHWAVVGGNGAGKTTLLELLHGQLHPASGGRVTRRHHGPQDPIEDWQRRVRYISPHLHNEMRSHATLLDIVLGGLPELRRLGSVASPRQRRAALKVLRATGIRTLARRSTREASYGELRLALLARALIGDPDALLLDEPLTGLDLGMRLRMIEALERARQRGVQLITSIHEEEDMLPCITHVLDLVSGSRHSCKVKASSSRSERRT